MNIDTEIQNLLDHRAWLLEHKERHHVLDMLKASATEKCITHLEATIKRLKTTKKLCEAKQMKLL